MDSQKKVEAWILTEYIRRIYDAGLTTMSGGNLSLRDTEGNIWVTPSGLDKGTLTAEDMMCAAPDGAIYGKTKVTSEFVVHKAILEKRPDKNAVLHAHSPVVLGFSTARIKPNENLLCAAAERMSGRVTISPYQRAGSPQLAEEVSSHLEGEARATILENHGIFMAGDTMGQCFADLELLELAGQIELQAGILGAPVSPMTEEELYALVGDETERLPEARELCRTPEDEQTAETICRLMKRMYSRQINTSSTGSFSVRRPDGSILITPQFEDVSRLEPEDIVKVKDGHCEPGKTVSGSFRLHEEIYAANPGVRTVIMAVPRYLMTYAACDASFSSEPVWEAYYLLRDVPKLPFGRGKDFIRNTARQFGDRTPTVLIQNDCCIVTSGDIMDAYDKVEVAEATAKGTILTSAVKPPVPVEREIIQMYDDLLDKMLFNRET